MAITEKAMTESTRTSKVRTSQARTMDAEQRSALRRRHLHCKLENSQVEGIALVREIREYLSERLDRIEEELVAANRYSTQLAAVECGQK